MQRWSKISTTIITWTQSQEVITVFRVMTRDRQVVFCYLLLVMY